MPVPEAIHTARLFLRPWRADDAGPLLPVLEANQAHLGSWIPRRVSEPVPVPQLAVRLAGFAADFAAGREWRYGMFTPDGAVVIGEVSLFPRDANGRVPFPGADRAEIGYCLRSDRTGRGLATEATRAMIDVAATLPGIGHIEIRCDARNAASAAIPQRLGFELAMMSEEPAHAPGAADSMLQVWTLALAQRA